MIGRLSRPFLVVLVDLELVNFRDRRLSLHSSAVEQVRVVVLFSHVIDHSGIDVQLILAEPCGIQPVQVDVEVLMLHYVLPLKLGLLQFFQLQLLHANDADRVSTSLLLLLACLLMAVNYDFLTVLYVAWGHRLVEHIHCKFLDLHAVDDVVFLGS